MARAIKCTVCKSFVTTPRSTVGQEEQLIILADTGVPPCLRTCGLVEEWSNILQQELANLAQFMRMRCTEVLKAAGGHTRYSL